MNVVTPTCPSCGAELTLEGGRIPGRCKFCQKDLVDADAGGARKPQDGLLVLARAAADAGNDEEAAALWSRVLESDTANVEAWFGKAKAIPMTLATMQRGYEQAESYVKRAIDLSAGSKDARSTAFGILATHLMTMTMAARSHFEEFWEVDGAAGEHLEQMFEILAAYDRLADLTGSNLAHVQAVEACDWLLSQIFAKAPGVRAEIERRRREHIAKGGPMLADEAQKPAAPTGARLPSVQRVARIGLAAVGATVLVLSFIGWGRWAGKSSTASSTPVPSNQGDAPTVATPTTTAPAPPGGMPSPGSRSALGFPQTVSFPSDSTWTILEVVDRGTALVPVKNGKPAQKTTGRWIVVRYEATNDGSTTASSSPDPRIVDAKGRSIELWAEESYDNYLRGKIRVLGTEDVKPGLKKDYWAIFEVPPGAPLKLRLHAMQGKGIRDLDVHFEGDPPSAAASATTKPKPPSTIWAKGNIDVCSKQCIAECGGPGGPCNRDCMMEHCY